MANAHSITQYQKELNTLHARIAQVDFHYQFTTTCLCSHTCTIPQGLTINVQPGLPKAPCWEPAALLQKQWARIIRGVAFWFLTALKVYQRSCAYHLRLQVTNVESSIATRLGKARAKRSKKIAETVYSKCNNNLTDQQNRKLKNFFLQIPVYNLFNMNNTRNVHNNF